MKPIHSKIVLILNAILFVNTLVQAQKTDTLSAQAYSQMGGPNSVSGQLKEDSDQRNYNKLKNSDEWLKSKMGLSFGGDYNITLNQISNSSGPTAAAGGIFRIYGNWNPSQKNVDFTGRLIFKAESRHLLGTEVSPQMLGPTAGYAGITAATFSDAGALLTNFYWTQSFFKNRLAINVGLVDFTDYVNLYGLINVWTDFNNLSFATGPTFITPNQGLGGAFRFMFTPKYYFIAGITDMNGDPHHPENMFSGFFGDAQYLTHAEIGRIGNWNSRYSNNTHITFWHADASELMGSDAGWGLAFSWSQSFGQFLTFARAEYSEGTAPFLNKSVSMGGGYQFKSRKDYFGLGLNWGQPPKDIVGGKTINQYTLETYYRVQLIPQLSIWPSFQYLVNPAYLTAKENLWLLGLRLRAAL